MRDNLRYFPVNWIDGMKINKNLFIAQDNAVKDAMHDVTALHLSPLKYGILPPSSEGEENYNIKLSIDNQNTLRVTILSCQAITPGGVRINIPVLARADQGFTDGVPAALFQFTASPGETVHWVVLTVHPFERQPAGSPDVAENPPRLPYVLPSYQVRLVPDNQYGQYANHPYALVIGKILVNAGNTRIEEDYIPPCFSVSAHPDLMTLHAELEHFLGELEMRCSKIVQKILKGNQQNELAQLVMFLCDRIMLYLGQSITHLRWMLVHESPAALFTSVLSLARVMKNTIDLRIGTGKEEMMNYFALWCGLKPGELENMMNNLSNLRYDNNDINKNIQPVAVFVKVTGKLFEELSNLDFIGAKKEGPVKFVKEEQEHARRRFFGGNP